MENMFPDFLHEKQNDSFRCYDKDMIFLKKKEVFASL